MSPITTLVTLRRADGSAAAYNTVEEALDQAAYDRECGYGELQDVIEGAHPDHQNVESPKILARSRDLDKHHAEWVKRWATVAGVLMPREDAERTGQL